MPGPPPELRRGRGLNNRTSGDLGEEIARRYLASKGYEIVESNYRTRRGELAKSSGWGVSQGNNRAEVYRYLSNICVVGRTPRSRG